MMLWMLRSTSAKVRAPVHTTLPLENTNAEVLGSFIRNTRPGNCSGLYSVFGKVAAIFSKGTSFSREVDTTIFTILTSFLFSFLTIYNPPHKLDFLYKARAEYLKTSF